MNSKAIAGKRLLRGSGAQGFSQAVQILIRFAEVPLFLTYWNAQLYGEWLMLSAIPIYLNICDGGFTMVACREMTIKAVSGDREGVASVFQSIWFLILMISIAMTLMAIGVAKYAPLKDWLGLTKMGFVEVNTVFLLLVFYVLIGFQSGLLNGKYWIQGNYPSSMYLIALTQLFEFIGIAVTIILGGGPVAAAFGYVTGKCIGTGLMWLKQHGTIPWLTVGFSHVSVKEIKRLTIPSLASLALPLGSALNIQGIRLIVGLTMGPAAVAAFVPMRTLSRILMQPGAVIGRLIQPELALAYGTGDKILFSQIFSRSCQVSIWGGVCVCILVVSVTHWIFPLWTGGMVALHWPTYSILLGGAIVNTFWCTAIMIPFSINRHGWAAIYYISIYGIAAVCLCYLFVEKYAFSGVAIALFLSEVVMAVIAIVISLQIAEIKIMEWIRQTFQAPLYLIEKFDAGFWKR